MKSNSKRIQTNQLGLRWARFWLKFSGVTLFGRFSSKMAALFFPPHKDRVKLAKLSNNGFISHRTIVSTSQLNIGKRVFVDDDCVLFQRDEGGAISLHNDVCIYRSSILETGCGGSISILAHASIHPKCQINANVNDIIIEEGVMLAPACALYSYDHSIALGVPIREQALKSKGDIVIKREAWLGYGVVVTSGVVIGEGAVIGAGSVVSKDIPDNAIAVGNPARVVGMRS